MKFSRIFLAFCFLCLYLLMFFNVRVRSSCFFLFCLRPSKTKSSPFNTRLGFVQPPCCLQDTFREGTKGAPANEKCTRWIIWRRDANVVLHPKNLCQNVIAVRCFAARKLLSGKVIDGNKWDPEQKRLVPA